jgi:bifunctional non-homologous end joining protein LigD
MAQSQMVEWAGVRRRRWSDPEGTRPHLEGLLLGCYSGDGKLTSAGRAGTGMPIKVLADLRRRLDPLARATSPWVHWVDPTLVVEMTYLTRTADNLLRHTVYVGLREDKPAGGVRRER